MKDLGKAAKAVESAAPKLEEVVKGAMSTVAGTDKASIKLAKHFNAIETSEKNIDESLKNFPNSQLKDYGVDPSYHSYMKTLVKDLGKLLKEYDMPKDLTTDIFQTLNKTTSNYGYRPNSGFLKVVKDYAKAVHTYDPIQRKNFKLIFDNLPKDIIDNFIGYELPSKLSATKDIYKKIESLTPAQQETFIALLPDYTGSIDELVVTARLL